MTPKKANKINLSNIRATIEHLRSLGRGYEFINFMNELTIEASSGDTDALNIFATMLKDCRDQVDWIEKNYWCSMAIRSLANTRTPESLKIIMGFVRKLPDNTPFGAIDLISSLLPVYKKFILGPAKELVKDDKKQAQKAIGLQTLCNLYLEGSLIGDQATYLESLIRNFEPDRYLTQHHVELVRTAIRSSKIVSTPASENKIPSAVDRSDSKEDIADEIINDILSDFE